jgi:hypothetical protein
MLSILAQRPVSPVVEWEVPFQNVNTLERIKIWAWVPTGPEVDCADEDPTVNY